jgi:hypothetical protein
MSFVSVNGQINIGATGVGELWDVGGFKITTRDFDPDIKIGTFAGRDAGTFKSGYAPEVIVLRDLNENLELVDGGFDPATSQIPLLREGAVTVAVVEGLATAPEMFGRVYMNNADGKATTLNDASTTVTTAEFIREIQSNIWLIRLV